MHECGVDSLSEGVCAARVCNPSTGRIPVVANPYMGSHIIQSIVVNHILCVTDDLQNQHILSMAQHERVRPLVRGVELDVQQVCIFEYQFIQHRLPVAEITLRKPTLFFESLNRRGFWPGEIADHIRWLVIKGWQLLCPIRQCRHLMDVVNLEGCVDEHLFDVSSDCIVEIGDCNHVIVRQYFLTDSKLVRLHAD